MWVSYLVDEVLGGPVTLEYWLGEVDELVVEVRARNLAGVREEWSDVVCLGLAHLVTRGWTWVRHLPLLPGLGLYAAKKFEARLETWSRIFYVHGVEFRREYIIGGGNFRKLRKVCAALALAGIEEDKVNVGWLRAAGICTE